MMALSQGKGNQTDKAPRQGQRPQADRGPLTCFKCGGIGHKAAECRANNVPTPAQHYARANYMESSYEEPTYEVPASCNAPMYHFGGRYADTAEPEMYATGNRVPLQRTPRNIVAFTPDQIRARAQGARDSRPPAGRTNAPRPEEAGPSRRPFPMPRAPAVMPSTSRARRTSDVDLVGQL